MDDLNKKILTDLKVELSEEFDRNFERKAFFSKPWQQRLLEGRGSLLLQSGKLRRSIRAQVTNNSVSWSSSEPYAAIHNEGGTITVTAKMKRFFWAKFYELAGKVRHKKNGSTSRSSVKLSKQAEFYRNLALKRVGSKIKIPKRQFLGNAPEVQNAIERVCQSRCKDIETELYNALKKS